MIWNVLDKYRDIGLLVMRIGLGFGFFWFHGWDKLIGGPERWIRNGSAIQLIGIDFWHTFFGFLAAFSESIGGMLIAAGFMFRPVSAMLCFTMCIAALSHVVSGNGNPGHAFKNAFIFAGLLMTGPGKYSLDAVISKKLNAGATD